MRRLCLVALISFAILIFAAAQSKNSQDDASVHRFLQSFDNGLKEKYVVAFTDLNGDGKPEAVVHLVSNDWCGSGGCTTLVLARDGDSWRVLSK